ncbi:MAG: hypothetical protein WCW16_01545 [Candidatus Magasanikbacteria bacterium]
MEGNMPRDILDIARQAVVVDATATTPDDLILTLQYWWTDGAESLGLPVRKFTEDIPPNIKVGMKLGTLIRVDDEGYVLIGLITELDKHNTEVVTTIALVPTNELTL